MSSQTIRTSAAEFFADNEPQENAVIRNFRITTADGKSYNTKHYKLTQGREISGLNAYE